MSKRLFVQILQKVEETYAYFQQKRDATGKLGAFPLQKVTAALRMRANGTAADTFDEYIWLSETTIIDCMKMFCSSVVKLFAEEYLRKPTGRDLDRILK